jgi:hypothetical protein
VCDVTLYRCVKNKAILKEEIKGHPKVSHVLPNRRFSEEEEKLQTDCNYLNVLQSISA